MERLHYNENRNNNEEDNPKIRELTQPDYNLEDCGKYNYEYERDKIIQVLRESNMSITKASNILGISRKTLYSKMKKYKIEIERQINTVL
ncbi:MAG: hypothetical protein GX363_06000 [Clostridiales bacterium]|nr:hypothetical protein [Clostridiales bacterium]